MPPGRPSFFAVSFKAAASPLFRAGFAVAAALETAEPTASADGTECEWQVLSGARRGPCASIACCCLFGGDGWGIDTADDSGHEERV